ncbi:P-loop containing nucleoside triphosphate hydrolase protein [Colletotrichum cereale]|nr:P-loop containing nucleoside triphosphate hydrolase protein [Colletotrichum cereale]
MGGIEVYRAVYDHKDESAEWRLIASQSRNIETIVLALGTKEKLLADLGSFLQPAAVEWYSARGIPYRRGYLFNGPPGTGKTSLCMALATRFNLPVYQLGLGSVEMNDSRLAELFDSVPSKCLLLIEDIDAVGLANREASPAERRDGVTLSGLLNLIDGIGAPEGRILIMTTNYAVNLDKALVRTGRIEKVCDFRMADKACAKFLFRSLMSVRGEELAQEFANKIPDDVFSPADLQSYLINTRDCPRTAVEEVEAWVEEKLQQSTVRATVVETRRDIEARNRRSAAGISEPMQDLGRAEI